ncbi:MAG: prephenate dehydrogenase [Chloroflexi bacterium]|nr:prephenate dehydrogenase [Chloroflexota bacterium]
MAVKLTIIGLGQIGGSIGLTLASQTEAIQRTGHDKEPEVARSAQKAGALDKVQFNLPASAEGADLIALAIPLNDVRDTLKFIREDLKEGAVILDFSPAKRQVEAWAGEILPEGRYYIGLAPAFNPVHLLETGGGLNAAHADLFAGATILVCPPFGTPESAVRLATDFVKLLGATPLLSDAVEVDGLMSAMTTMPKLLAYALADSTMGKPGWRDSQNMAGRSYAMTVASAFDRDDADGLRQATLANRDNIVRLLDEHIETLLRLRDLVQAEDREALAKKMRDTQTKVYGWLSARGIEKYQPPAKRKEEKHEPQSMGERMKQMFWGTRKPRENK